MHIAKLRKKIGLSETRSDRDRARRRLPLRGVNGAPLPPALLRRRRGAARAAALLARRALQSVELEREARHQTVAERVFDEMERALSGFLATEEERPFGHYAPQYTPPGESAGVLARSPLADPPALPFVVGYFQLDPDGSLVHLSRGATGDAARRAT